jgi:hypothetical protein
MYLLIVSYIQSLRLYKELPLADLFFLQEIELVEAYIEKQILHFNCFDNETIE